MAPIRLLKPWSRRQAGQSCHIFQFKYPTSFTADILLRGFTKNWGTKPSEILNKVSLPVVSRKSCESRYRDLDLFGIPENITENMFCAGYIEDGDVPNDKDTCQGDSGGPIVDPETGNVVGIISWGSPACGANTYLGVNARVGSLRSFINKYLS